MVRASASSTVHKFGGAALADADAIRHAARIVASGPTKGTVVVASAMNGVTDALLEIATLARTDRAAATRASQKLRMRHLETAADLALDDDIRGPLTEALDREFGDLTTLCDAIAVTGGPPSLATTDAILARGERASARLLATALGAAGVHAEVVDATLVVRADGRHGSAAPDIVRTTAAVKEHLAPVLRRGVVPVVAGFIGSSPDGSIVTLGRGGSDLTATLLGRALGARTVTLWKDVAGVLTADPRVVPEARFLPRIHVREAAELAYYGAKVLHPRALIGLGEGTQLYIRPLADPSVPGTEISTRRDPTAEKRHPVRAISAIGAQAIITISGDGMVGVPGTAARAFGALERAGISVSLISQASSEHSICLVVPSAVGAAAGDALRAAFADLLARGEIEEIDVRTEMSILAVVGLGMSGTPGIAARLFGAIADANVNIVAIAQGASELNISVVVESRSAATVQRAVHAAFRLDKIGGGSATSMTTADVVILGYGRIGRELATQLGALTASRAVRVVAVIDSSGYVFEPRGLSRRRLATLAKAKDAGQALATVPRGVRASAEEAIAEVKRHALSRPILVDVTAGDTSAVLEAAMTGGMDLVLANKRPLAVPHGKTGGLARSAASRGRRLLHEATVGAGLPIIDTINKLQESGDAILRIEGCPSGTLGYLFGELGRGTPFSAALRAAKSLGYTEPDPREDLSGMDVARKALILARLIGFEGELDAVDVESLVPDEYRSVSPAAFLSRLEELDPRWQARVDEARERDTVLRYRATVTSDSVRVGLVAVDTSSSLATLSGTDNQFSITTKRYRDNPIVITGPGAGVAVTAAGVLNDVLKIAGSR
jgi:aspartokinase/homoserine dehydrogenase 1